jgi:anaerobic selenocysteine-containing dehydrogenase
MMNKKDMIHMGLMEDDRVVVKSKTGQIRNFLARPFNIKRGTVLMYYPEANALISQEVDPMSRTRGFKSAIVSVGLS